jgi:hypothetical protein
MKFMAGSMITPDEYCALASFAEQAWSAGAPRDGAIVDGGCFIGASTCALAEGLSVSTLPENERIGRIWSYDLFRATPAMAAHYLEGEEIAHGGSFRHVYDRNVGALSRYVRTFEGDMIAAPKPDGPVAILFLDVIWSWSAAEALADQLYSKLVPGRSVLIHQDFVYPFYPWIILSMGLLGEVLTFSHNVPYSSVVFDVRRKFRAGSLAGFSGISDKDAMAIYDAFIDRLNGWGKGALALGKALFMASRHKLDRADNLIADVERGFSDEPLVMQYVPSIRAYCHSARETGFAQPIDSIVGQ